MGKERGALSVERGAWAEDGEERGALSVERGAWAEDGGLLAHGIYLPGEESVSCLDKRFMQAMMDYTLIRQSGAFR